MIKVLLLIILYNSNTGELVSVYQQNNKLPGFPSLAACEAAVKNDVPNFQVPPGLSINVKCIDPSATSI